MVVPKHERVFKRRRKKERKKKKNDLFNIFLVSVASREPDFASPRFLQTETKEPAAQNSQASARSLLSFTVFVNSVILLLRR